MLVKTQHSICAQQVELEFQGYQQDLFLQEKVSNTIKEKLLPEMEKLFDEKFSNKHIKIETLSVELGNININNWENEFVEALIQQLRIKLNEVTSFISGDEIYEVKYIDNKPSVKNKNAVEEYFNALIYFLQTGLLKWNESEIDFNYLNSFHQADNNTSFFWQQLIEKGILFSAISVQRFLLHFSSKQIKFIYSDILAVTYYEVFQEKFLESANKNIDHIYASTLKSISFLLLVLSSTEKLFHGKAKIIIADIISRDEKQGERIFHLFDKTQTKKFVTVLPADRILIFKKNIADITNTVEKKLPLEIEHNTSNTETAKVYFIKNAGLVLIHPFLVPFYNSLEYLSEQNFRDMQIHGKAVLLSQFLVNAETDIPEYNLLLNKIICGFPVSETVNNKLKLTDDEISEANNLLESVLKYWTALKSTSVKGLQSSFLQRDGKLTDKEDYWLLQVEQKSYDILLSFLPWSISIIKLSWMQKRIMVEWCS